MNVVSTVKPKINVDKKWLFDILDTLNIKQLEFAKALGLSPSAFNYVMQGKRRIHLDEADRIAKLLSLPIEEVLERLGWELPPPRQSLCSRCKAELEH